MLAAKDVLWIRDLLVDMGFKLSGPTIMYCDAKSAVEMAFDVVSFKHTKHILRAAFFLRDHVMKEDVSLRHLSGVIMIADILTKGVARPLFLQLLKLLDDYSSNPVASAQSS